MEARLNNTNLSGVDISHTLPGVRFGNVPAKRPVAPDPGLAPLAAWNFIGSNYDSANVVPDTTGNGLDFTIVNSQHNYNSGWDAGMGLRFDGTGMYISTHNFSLGKDFTIVLFADVYGNYGTNRSGFCKKDVLYSAFISNLKLETAYVSAFTKPYKTAVKAITSKGYMADSDGYVFAQTGVYEKEELPGGLTYGTDETVGKFCGGRLFAVRLYNKILSGTAIQDAYNNMVEDFRMLLFKDWKVVPNNAGRPVNVASDLDLSYNAVDTLSSGRFLFAADASYILSADYPCFNVAYTDFDYSVTINQNQKIGRYYLITLFGTLSAPPAQTGGHLESWQICLMGRSTHGICLRYDSNKNWDAEANAGREVYLKNEINKDYTIRIEKRRDTLRGYVDGVLFWNFDITGWVPKIQGNRILIGRAVGGWDTFRGTVSGIQYKAIDINF